MNRLVLISGCSGGGKSTLLTELGRRGYAVIEEPGRRIIAEETEETGAALPWVSMKAFAHRTIEMSRTDLAVAEQKGNLTFFDRGLIDAAVALEYSSGVSLQETLGKKHHYFKTVFLAPPWPEIYCQDKERRHDLSIAMEEFGRLETAFYDLGYDISLLPKASLSARVDFVLSTLKKAMTPGKSAH